MLSKTIDHIPLTCHAVLVFRSCLRQVVVVMFWPENSAGPCLRQDYKFCVAWIKLFNNALILPGFIDLMNTRATISEVTFSKTGG
jgi:hypothetical protein